MTAVAAKDRSQERQKAMLAAYYARLGRTDRTGEKCVYTFVPGNLIELLLAFDLAPVLPEINALQSAMRGRAGAQLALAEKLGHSEDVCAYVKASIGALRGDETGPTGERMPRPDLLLLSYTGCFTFLKWFEILREETGAPVLMLHVPYQGEGRVTTEMREYVVRQLRESVIPALERLSGRAYDEDRLKEILRRSAQAEDDLVRVFKSARNRPSPIDGYFGAVYYVGPIFSAFRGTEDAIAYYRELREEVDERLARGEGPTTPDGPMGPQKYRIVVEGPPSWSNFRELWRMFAAEGAVCVASTYARVGGLYDDGFRHDPDRPLESIADYCLGCYTNRSLPSRVDLLSRWIEEYDADGFLVHSVKSCDSFSAGQLVILKETERRTGRPGGFFESDLVDPRYFSAANIKNRLESYFQMLAQKGRGAGVP